MLTTPAHLAGPAMAVTDKAFYKQLGQRVAERRKAAGMTQVQLAERLGIAQQTLAHYEGGTLRVAVATLLPLCEVLETSIEELVGMSTKRTAGGKRGPAPKIQQQLEQVSRLPKAKQRAIAQVLDSMLGS
jgi:transcriptional regulator with XRE-family HTH domain